MHILLYDRQNFASLASYCSVLWLSPVYSIPEEFENATLFIPFTQVRRENGVFQKLSSNRRNLKTPVLRFSWDRILKRSLVAIIVMLVCPSFILTETRNVRNLMVWSRVRFVVSKLGLILLQCDVINIRNSEAFSNVFTNEGIFWAGSGLPDRASNLGPVWNSGGETWSF